MRKRYSISAARDQLSAIVRHAESGHEVELTSRGKPVAVLMSVARYEVLAAPRHNFWEALQAFRARHDLTDIDIDAAFADVRDRAPGSDMIRS